MTTTKIILEIWSSINATGSVIGIYTNSPSTSSDRNLILENIEGWEERQATYETVPALFENGSYITNRRLPEFDITVSLVITNNNIFLIKDKIVNQIELLSPMSFRLNKYKTTGTITELINAYPTSVDEFEVIGKSDDGVPVYRLTFTAKNISGQIIR